MIAFSVIIYQLFSHSRSMDHDSDLGEVIEKWNQMKYGESMDRYIVIKMSGSNLISIIAYFFDCLK